MHWTDIVTSPDVTEWSDVLIPRHPFDSNSHLAHQRRTARRRLTEAAEQYVLRLRNAAQSAGVNVPENRIFGSDPQIRPIIMTGHQPIIFHSGITFKYECTEQVADGSAIGVSVTIDTDTGDPGMFRYPQTVPDTRQSESNQLVLTSATFASSTGLYRSVELLPAEQIAQQTQLVTAELKSTATSGTQTQFCDISADYCRLAKIDVKAAEANTIVRWSRGMGCRLLELPLSEICVFPEVLELTASILEKHELFAQAYNGCLADYRNTHGIRNQANPFPELQSDPEGTELPFWVLDDSSQTRHRAVVRRIRGAMTMFADGRSVETFPPGGSVEVLKNLLRQGIQLIPRGAMITGFLRLLFADLFVHGTGGGHYDQFTTEFLRSWWNVEPPPFVVASASRFLYEERHTELRTCQSLNEKLRDMQFNPQRQFGTGVFSEPVEAELQRLCVQKEAEVAQLRFAQNTGQSAKDVGHRIQLLSNAIKTKVNDTFSEQLTVLQNLTPETQAAIECRTYPWFLFPAPSAGQSGKS